MIRAGFRRREDTRREATMAIRVKVYSLSPVEIPE